MSDDLITRSFLEIEKYLTLNEKDYENTPALDSEEKENSSLPEEQQNNTSKKSLENFYKKSYNIRVKQRKADWF